MFVLQAELAAFDQAVDDDLIAPQDSLGPLGLGSGSTTPPHSECLLAPQLLLAVVSEPAPDVALQVLPLCQEVTEAVREELVQTGFKGLGIQGHKGVMQLLGGYADAGRALVVAANKRNMKRQEGDGFGGAAPAAAAGGAAAAWEVVDLTAGCQQLFRLLDENVPKLTVAKSGGGGEGKAGGGAEGEAAGDLKIPSGGAAAGPSEYAPWRRTLRQEAAHELMHRPERLGQVTGALQLLALLLKNPQQLAEAVAASGSSSSSGAGRDGGSEGMPSGAGGGSFHARESLEKMLGLDPMVGEVTREFVTGGGLQLLERMLRMAVAVWEGCQDDMAWSVQGGDAIDVAERLRVRRRGAALLLAAGRATAAALLRLNGKQMGGSYGLAGALVVAHAAVVLSAEGLVAGAGESGVVTAAVAAASTGGSGGSVTGDMLCARHALAVALSLWQRNKWAPAAVPAVLGVYPVRRGALVMWEEEQRKAAAEEKKAGGLVLGEDRGEGVKMPPTAGPAGLMSALLALGDVCPGEWPPMGSSQRIAKLAAQQHEAAGGAAEKEIKGFGPPSDMVLRGGIAQCFTDHMDALKRVVVFGVGSESRLVRGALVRLCAKASGLGGGMAPFLAPLLLEELIAVMKQAGPATAGAGAAQAAGSGLADGRRVVEVLLPLAGQPAMKAALMECKAVSTMARYLHRLAGKVKEEPEAAQVRRG